MGKEFKRLPDLELEVMLAIWGSDEPMHTGEIAQRLDKSKIRPIQAVQTVLSRLGEKGFVRCEKKGRFNYYYPLVAEENYLKDETASFLEKLYGNSPSKLVAALVKSAPMSEEDLSEIRKILEAGGCSK